MLEKKDGDYHLVATEYYVSFLDCLVILALFISDFQCTFVGAFLDTINTLLTVNHAIGFVLGFFSTHTHHSSQFLRFA